MKPLFIHHALFRILSPVFTGSLVYLLILLINNNVDQLNDYFLGEELYLCIGLSFLIQEFSRLLVLIYKKINKAMPTFYTLLISIFLALLLSFTIVTIVIEIYYKHRLGYSPNSSELWMFNGIFGTVSLIYVLLHISHQYLYNVNSLKLNEELIRKQTIEDDFIQFKNSINPQLLFESLEAIIILMKKDVHQTDELINSLAETYRYILTNEKRDLVDIAKELNIVQKMVSLLNFLPNYSLDFTDSIRSSFLIIPGTLLSLVERILRKSISTDLIPLSISVNDIENHLTLAYPYRDKINTTFSNDDLKDIMDVYKIYCDQEFIIDEREEIRTIYIPKLQLNTSA